MWSVMLLIVLDRMNSEMFMHKKNVWMAIKKANSLKLKY